MKPDPPAPSQRRGAPVAAAQSGAGPVAIAVNQEETAPADDVNVEVPAVEAPEIEATRVEAPSLEPDLETTSDARPQVPKVDVPKVDAVKLEAPQSPGKLMIMSPGERIWDGERSGAHSTNNEKPAASGQRRFAAMAAVVALAVVAGAIGGAIATAGLGQYSAREVAARDVTAPKDTALQASVARIDADIAALKASVEQNSKTGAGQLNKTNDRIEKLEKAQAEPAAKLARLSEAVDKLRAPPPAAAPVAAAPARGETTGSVTPASPQAAAPAKPEVARLPTVEGWVLRDVSNGGALIEGRQGLYEVYAGDPVPGVGRVDAIRKQDGRWVVVTSRGLIVAR